MRQIPRSHFPNFVEIATRWMDNDVYGHVNNVQYYSYFDTAVNQFLITSGVLNMQSDAVVGFVVDSACAYFSPVAFPDRVHVGLRVARIGTTSVRYELAVYRNDAQWPSAAGHFVHVYVDKSSQQSVPVPIAVRAVLEGLQRQ